MKTVRIALLFLLLSAQNSLQAGIPVFFHYCGGDLATISFFDKGDGCCGDEAATDMDCCSTDINILQQHSDFTSQSENASLDIPSVPLATIQWIAPRVPLQPEIVTLFIEPPPPPLQSRWLQTFVLRI
jgi:hypothetical protein